MTVEPRVMRILPRGNWMNDSGDIVTPALPEFLAHAPAKKDGPRAWTWRSGWPHAITLWQPGSS